MNYQEKLEEIFEKYLKGYKEEFERYEELYHLIAKAIPAMDKPYAGGTPAEDSLPYEKPVKRIPKWLAYLGIASIAAGTIFTTGLIAYAKLGNDKKINEFRENVKKYLSLAL